MAADCCSSCEYQRTIGYPSTSWASCLYCDIVWNSTTISSLVITGQALFGQASPPACLPSCESARKLTTCLSIPPLARRLLSWWLVTAGLLNLKLYGPTLCMQCDNDGDLCTPCNWSLSESRYHSNITVCDNDGDLCTPCNWSLSESRYHSNITVPNQRYNIDVL